MDLEGNILGQDSNLFGLIGTEEEHTLAISAAIEQSSLITSTWFDNSVQELKVRNRLCQYLTL